MKIYDLLPVGAENAISKARLVEITGLSERALRAVAAAIEQAALEAIGQERLSGW